MDYWYPSTPSTTYMRHGLFKHCFNVCSNVSRRHPTIAGTENYFVNVKYTMLSIAMVYSLLILQSSNSYQFSRGDGLQLELWVLSRGLTSWLLLVLYIKCKAVSVNYVRMLKNTYDNLWFPDESLCIYRNL